MLGRHCYPATYSALKRLLKNIMPKKYLWKKVCFDVSQIIIRFLELKIMSPPLSYLCSLRLAFIYIYETFQNKCKFLKFYQYQNDCLHHFTKPRFISTTSLWIFPFFSFGDICYVVLYSFMNSIWKPGWPQTHRPSFASVSQVLRKYTYATGDAQFVKFWVCLCFVFEIGSLSM